VIGTPDDAVARIEELRGKLDFGCFLVFAHHWADWERTKKSYELFARFVLPRLRRSDRVRRASLQHTLDNGEAISNALISSRKVIFEQHAAERAAKAPPSPPAS